MKFKTILDYFIKTEYFDDMDLVIKRFYFIYTVAGGIYYESYVRRWFRYFLFTCLVLDYISLFIYYYGVWSQKSMLELHTIVHFVSHSTPALFNRLELLSFYLNRENLKNVIDKIHLYFKRNTTQMPMDSSSQENKYMRYLVSSSFYLIIIMPLGICFGKLIKCLLITETEAIDIVYDYLYPFPFITSPSLLQYSVVSLVQIIWVVMLVNNACVSPIFQFYMLKFLKNHVISLREHMKLHSNSISRVIEESYDQELAILQCKRLYNKKLKLLQIVKERESCYKTFADHLTLTWIPRHQHIISHMKCVEKFIQMVSSLKITSMMITSLTIIPITIVEENTVYLNFIVPLMSYLFFTCIIGHLYEDMTNDLSEEIYASPWYWLPPYQRKTILTFLVIVQKPHPIHYFGAFKISLSLFPSILSNLYDYVRVVLLLDQRSRAPR